MEINKNRK